MNDSFVDFDLIGQVDPVTYKVTRLSFYAELIWDARKARAKADGSSDRLGRAAQPRPAYRGAQHAPRVEALDQLAKRVGFRIIPGLGERVIYRELFPRGLTMLDAREFGEVGLAHVAARQELREMMAALGLPEPRDAAVRLMAKILFHRPGAVRRLAARCAGARRRRRSTRRRRAPSWAWTAPPMPRRSARRIAAWSRPSTPTAADPPSWRGGSTPRATCCSKSATDLLPCE